MALSSMTGFARSHGASGSYVWSWEIKSVNAKGLDLRFRLPPGFDAVEVAARARAAERLSRGNVYANLTISRENVTPVVRVNEPVLAALLATIRNLSGQVDAEKPRLDGVLGLKGVVEVIEQEDSEDVRAAAEAAMIESFTEALTGLSEMRRHEGRRLASCLRRGSMKWRRSRRVPKPCRVVSPRRSRSGWRSRLPP
jgi:uncharacterized protein (TIGR00255 family)